MNIEFIEYLIGFLRGSLSSRSYELEIYRSLLIFHKITGMSVIPDARNYTASDWLSIGITKRPEYKVETPFWYWIDNDLYFAILEPYQN